MAYFISTNNQFFASVAFWLEKSGLVDIPAKGKSETSRFRSALADVRARRDELEKETTATDKELENIRAKKERLGLAFADGALAK